MNREKCEWRRDCATAHREVLECSEDTEHGELCVFVVDLVTSLCFGMVVDYVFCGVRITQC